MSDSRMRLYGLALLPQLGWNRKLSYMVVWEKDSREDVCVGYVYHDMDSKGVDFWVTYDRGPEFRGTLGEVVYYLRTRGVEEGLITSPVGTGTGTGTDTQTDT